MPCNDVTEELRVALDSRDRVTRYSLSKITCGGSVAGDGLLNDMVLDHPIQEILALGPEALAGRTPAGSVEEYLGLKHLLAIQAVLAEYTGQQTPDTGRLLSITGVAYDTDGVEVSAVIKLPILTEKITACGRCGDRCRGAVAG